jgi:hypothetical protein
MAAYLAVNRVVPAFPCEGFPYAVLCDSALCLEQGGRLAVLLSPKELRAQVHDLSGAQSIAARYDSQCEQPELSDRPRFFSVRGGYQDSDGSWWESCSWP